MSDEDRMEAHNKGELVDGRAEANRLDTIAEKKLNERSDIARKLTAHYVNAAEAMLKAIGIEYEKQADTNAFIFKRSHLQKILDLVHHEKGKFVGETAPVITDFLAGEQTLAQIVADRPFTQRMAEKSKQAAVMAR